MRLESDFEVVQTLGADRYRETILVRTRTDGSIRVAKKYWIASNCGWQNVSLLDNFSKCFEVPFYRGESLPGIPALIDTFTQVDPVTNHDVEVKIWEYIEGDPLGSDTAPTKVLAPTEIDEMVKSLLKTVEHLTNQGLVHCDIEPSNIIRGTDGHWYLIDLDTISRGYQTIVGTNSYRGTLAFMAPERFTGRITFLSDIYGIALSIIMAIGGLSTDQLFNYRNEDLAHDIGRLLKAFTGLAPILSWLNRALLITDPFVSVHQAQEAWNDCWRTPRVGPLNGEYKVLTLSGAYCETKDGVFWWRCEGECSILSLIKGGTGEIQNLHYENVAGKKYSLKYKPRSWISNELLELGIDYGELIRYGCVRFSPRWNPDFKHVRNEISLI